MKRLQEMKSNESTLHIPDKDFSTKPKQTKVVLNQNDNNEKNNHPETKLMIEDDSKMKKKRKKKEKKEDDPLKTHPDGEWGWVVVGAAFLTQCIVVGLQNSSGVIFNELIKKYNESRGNTGMKIFLLPLITA